MGQRALCDLSSSTPLVFRTLVLTVVFTATRFFSLIGAALINRFRRTGALPTDQSFRVGGGG